MLNMNNPFLIVGYQGPEYFCDREKETEVILSALHNGRNITLVSRITSRNLRWRRFSTTCGSLEENVIWLL